METPHTSGPKQSRAEKRAALDAAIETALGRVSLGNLSVPEVIARAKAGDHTSAHALIGLACIIVRDDRPFEDLLEPMRDYLSQALQQAYDNPDKIAQAFNLVTKAGRTKYQNEGRDIRIIRLVAALHDYGFALKLPHPKSAFEEAERILRRNSRGPWRIGAAGIKGVWARRGTVIKKST